MTFTLIDDSAEDVLHATIIAETQAAEHSKSKIPNICFLHARFFQIGVKPESADIVALLQDIPGVKDGTLFVCSDGDVFVKWVSDDPKSIGDQIVKRITDTYENKIKEFMKTTEFFVFYDLVSDRDGLKAECTKKLKKQSQKSKKLSKHLNDPQILGTFRKIIQIIHMQRTFRVNPHILIVEDQIFSQKILKSILKDFTCHVVDCAGDAILQYIEKCPDIVFLDIELPDLSGHNVSKFIKEIDPNAYIVMVTGNRYEADIKLAKENNVKSFILKPYEKDKILDVIDQFKRTRRGKSA